MAEGAPPLVEKPPATLPVEQDFLESLLNKHCKTSAKIDHVDCEIIAEGKGFMSTITKADITWNHADDSAGKLPSSVIFKIPTIEKIKAMPVIKEFVTEEIVQGVHNAEVAAYKYLNSHPPTPIPLARCFYSTECTAPGTGMLILETVKGRSHTFNEDNTLQQTKNLLDHIAQLQAYALKHQEFRELKRVDFDFTDTMVDQIIPAGAVLREKYPEEFHLTDDQLQKAIDKFQEVKQFMMEPEKTKYALTFGLGDTQPNNILWKENEDGSLSDDVEAFLDFQAAFRYVYAFDVAAIMNNGMSLSHLRDHSEEVMETYYDKLLEYTGTTPVGLEELKETYQMTTYTYVCMFTAFISQMDTVKHVMGITDDRLKEMVAKINFLYSVTGL